MGCVYGLMDVCWRWVVGGRDNVECEMRLMVGIWWEYVRFRG